MSADIQEYMTVEKESSDEFTERKSRFIGYIKPVQEENQAVEFIEKIRKKHWDATHNVYAYILDGGRVKRYSDDGEPKGTAGIPVLDVLEKEGLTDCVVVVTRYFGGILLGAGGLVRAYSHGARIAVDAGGRLRMRLRSVMSVKCDYSFYGRLQLFIPQMDGIIEDTEFTENIKITFTLPHGADGEFNRKLADLSNGSMQAEAVGVRFAGEPVTK